MSKQLAYRIELKLKGSSLSLLTCSYSNFTQENWECAIILIGVLEQVKKKLHSLNWNPCQGKMDFLKIKSKLHTEKLNLHSTGCLSRWQNLLITCLKHWNIIQSLRYILSAKSLNSLRIRFSSGMNFAWNLFFFNLFLAQESDLID